MSDNFLVKDGGGANLTKASKDIGSGVQADKSVLINGSDNAVVDPANAGNQATQTTAITLINTRVGDITSPAAGSLNYRVGQLVTALGSPLQAGGSVGISGTLPAFAATPTFNIGTAPTIAVTGTFYQATQPVSASALPLPTGAATATGVAAINTTLGTPFQAGGSIANTAFGISGTLPAFAATPTFNLGTLNGAATSAKQDTMITSLAAIAAAAADTTPSVVTSQGSDGTTARTLKTGTNGGLLPGQATPTSVRTTLTSNTITSISAANTNRLAASIQCDGSPAAAIYIGFGSAMATGLTATNFDLKIASGAADATIFFPPFGNTGAIYALSTGTPVLNVSSWAVQ